MGTKEENDILQDWVKNTSKFMHRYRMQDTDYRKIYYETASEEEQLEILFDEIEGNYDG